MLYLFIYTKLSGVLLQIYKCKNPAAGIKISPFNSSSIQDFWLMFAGHLGCSHFPILLLLLFCHWASSLHLLPARSATTPMNKLQKPEPELIGGLAGRWGLSTLRGWAPSFMQVCVCTCVRECVCVRTRVCAVTHRWGHSGASPSQQSQPLAARS